MKKGGILTYVVGYGILRFHFSARGMYGLTIFIFD